MDGHLVRPLVRSEGTLVVWEKPENIGKHTMMEEVMRNPRGASTENRIFWKNSSYPLLIIQYMLGILTKLPLLGTSALQRIQAYGLIFSPSGSWSSHQPKRLSFGLGCKLEHGVPSSFQFTRCKDLHLFWPLGIFFSPARLYHHPYTPWTWKSDASHAAMPPCWF